MRILIVISILFSVILIYGKGIFHIKSYGYSKIDNFGIYQAIITQRIEVNITEIGEADSTEENGIDVWSYNRSSGLITPCVIIVSCSSCTCRCNGAYGASITYIVAYIA